MITNFWQSPSRFFLFSVYTLILFILLLTPSNFLRAWILIEIGSLVFLCIILRISSRSGYTRNILYFILQACFGINIIIFYSVEEFISIAPTITTLFILTKLGSAPFNILYFYSLNFLDITLFFLALSPQKVFPAILLISHCTTSSVNTIILFIFLSRISIMFMSLNINPLRRVLVTSSLYNSSWLILTCLSGYSIFRVYFLVYTLCLFFILFKNILIIPIMTLIGLPPLPLFFVKLRTVYFLLLSVTSTIYLSLVLFTLFLSSLTILSIYFRTITQRVT